MKTYQQFRFIKTDGYILYYILIESLEVPSPFERSCFVTQFGWMVKLKKINEEELLSLFCQSCAMSDWTVESE